MKKIISLMAVTLISASFIVADSPAVLAGGGAPVSPPVRRAPAPKKPIQKKPTPKKPVSAPAPASAPTPGVGPGIGPAVAPGVPGIGSGFPCIGPGGIPCGAANCASCVGGNCSSFAGPFDFGESVCASGFCQTCESCRRDTTVTIILDKDHDCGKCRNGRKFFRLAEARELLERGNIAGARAVLRDFNRHLYFSGCGSGCR